MAPKRKNAASVADAVDEHQPSTTTTSTSAPPEHPPAPALQPPSAASARAAAARSKGGSNNTPAVAGLARIATDVWVQYVADTPQPTKLIDAFLGFLVVVGVLQFAYCVLAGNYPFNAFLSGFSAAVGQFVLTVSLRIQTLGAYRKEFSKISPERAFSDYVVCSLILHFFCISYIN
jgi:oligosaccharyltransferase complex subunit epsilon